MPPKHSILKSSVFPMLFLLAAWAIFYADNHYKIGLYQLGLEPRSINGLLGLVTMPLLHGDLGHIISNSIPILVLGTLLFYFYRAIAFKVFFLIYFSCGALVWIFARNTGPNPVFHIGASGLIYGLAGFLFFSGIIRKHKALFGVALLVTFLYGSVIWGIFPTEFQQAIHYIQKKENISWEGHLFGFISGASLAYIYRKHGIQQPVYSWDINNDADVDENNPYWMVNENGEELNNTPGEDLVKNTSDNPYTVNYTFVPKKDDEQ